MNPTREELLRLLNVMSRKWPDMRLGQWIVALSFLGTGKTDRIYDVEDEELLQAARSHLKHRGADLQDLESFLAAAEETVEQPEAAEHLVP